MSRESLCVCVCVGGVCVCVGGGGGVSAKFQSDKWTEAPRNSGSRYLRVWQTGKKICSFQLPFHPAGPPPSAPAVESSTPSIPSPRARVQRTGSCVEVCAVPFVRRRSGLFSAQHDCQLLGGGGGGGGVAAGWQRHDKNAGRLRPGSTGIRIKCTGRVRGCLSFTTPPGFGAWNCVGVDYIIIKAQGILFAIVVFFVFEAHQKNEKKEEERPWVFCSPWGSISFLTRIKKRKQRRSEAMLWLV